ncbi:MAG: hypothetical protein IGS48_09090 [Oscillatoriales cyanobacterium C42_A2020_001]|nr:hypothetical protein [Leptolyngbyaceae cyanobacterium C42_A2020_001]
MSRTEGVSSPLSAPLNITVDSIPPNLTLKQLEPGAILSPISRLVGTVEGTGTGIAKVEYWFGDLPPVAISVNATGEFDQALDLTGVTAIPNSKF